MILILNRLKALMYALPIMRILRHSRIEKSQTDTELESLKQRSDDNERRVHELDRRVQRIEDEYHVLSREADAHK